MSTGIRQFDGVLQFVIMGGLHERGERERRREGGDGKRDLGSNIPITLGFLPLYNKFL